MITFILTLVVGLVPGILIGIVLFLLNLLAKIIRPHIECKLEQLIVEENNNQLCYSYLLVKPTQSIHFPSIDYLVSKTIESLPITSISKSEDTKFVVLIDGKHIYHTDSTFMKGIKDCVLLLKTRGIKIVFHNFQTSIQRKLHTLFPDNTAALINSNKDNDLVKTIISAYSML
ncbi:sodium-independent sulfate anion transporter-like protein [Leptotrombidium deliense]|uniref:Sodium-independent sulfate anion transporter-like protein n=1 Tax=Leptotrombidium deliense TaxID=299467 RepID=A0A443RWQ1_9ACAR|nr:sodium-independent sulfate anion transporter-like protein [Leptotrombidium deliense]